MNYILLSNIVKKQAVILVTHVGWWVEADWVADNYH